MSPTCSHEQLNKVAVIGTSMGGLMAMVMHAMNPNIFTMNELLSRIERIKGYVEKARSYANHNGVAFLELTDADGDRAKSMV